MKKKTLKVNFSKKVIPKFKYFIEHVNAIFAMHLRDSRITVRRRS